MYTGSVPSIRFALDFELYDELRNLVPEATVTVSARRINLAFKGTKSAHGFMDEIAEDVDLLERAVKHWYFASVPDLLEGPAVRLRQHIHLPPADLPAVVSCLRLLRRLRPAATAADHGPAGPRKSTRAHKD